MNWKLYGKDLYLDEGETRDLNVVLERETRAAIHGIVRFPNGIPVRNALVKLFRKNDYNPYDLTPVTYAFTDDYGHFMFGVESRADYVIKVFHYRPEGKEWESDREQRSFIKKSGTDAFTNTSTNTSANANTNTANNTDSSVNTCPCE